MNSIRSSSATERALQAHDVLYEVFAHVKAQIDFSASQPESNVDWRKTTLLSAALTCEAFRWPALKFLWQDVPSFDSLFYVLSSSIKVVQWYDKPRPVVSFMDGTWTTVSPITDRERERMRTYARFINTMCLRISYPIDSTVFRSLAEAGLCAPLAPCLHTVYGEHGWHQMDEALILLGGSSFRKLELNLSHLSDRLGPRMPNVLGRLCAAAPKIEKFVVSQHGYVTYSMCALASLKNLRVLDLSMVTGSICHHTDLIPALASLEHLEELSIPDTSDDRIAGSGTFVPCAGFTRLRKLGVIGGLSTLPMLFANLPDLRLKDLRFAKLDRSDLSFFHQIIQSCSHKQRRSIEVLHVHYIRGSNRAVPLVPDISPLFKLPNIQEFSVAAQEACLIDDAGFRAIGEAWPDLVSLNLQCYPLMETEPAAPTIHGIVMLMARCLNLRTISLPSIQLVRENRIVEPPFLVTGHRWLPHCYNLPDDWISGIDVGRLVDMLWPLFGVVYTEESNSSLKLFSDKWSIVLHEMALAQKEHQASRSRRMDMIG